MSSYQKRQVRWLVGPLTLWVILSPLMGCSMKGAVNPEFTTLAVDRVPVTVGVFYSTEFRTYEKTRSLATGPFTVPVGEPSVRLFEQLFHAMFENVVHVQGPPPLARAAPALAAVIEPKIEEFDVDWDMWRAFQGEDAHWAEITYRITLYSPEGSSIASWTVKGRGERGEFPRKCCSRLVYLAEATAFAMQDAALKIMTGFRNVPEVQQWLQRVEGSGSGE